MSFKVSVSYVVLYIICCTHADMTVNKIVLSTGI